MNKGPVLERRAAVRYKLRLPVIFHWNDGVERTDGGFTTDVSLDGASILSSKCPPVGSNVRIEVLFPAPDNKEDEIRIELSGKVTYQRGPRSFGVEGFFEDDQLTLHIRD
jgi:PilZ domain